MKTGKDSLEEQIHKLQRWCRFQHKFQRFVWLQALFTLLYISYHALLVILSDKKVISPVAIATWSPPSLLRIVYLGSLLLMGLSCRMEFLLTEYFASKVQTLSALVSPAQWTIPVIRAHLLTFSVGSPSSPEFERRLYYFENLIRSLTELIREDRLEGMTFVEWKWLLDTFFRYGYAQDDQVIISLQQAVLEAIARHRVLYAKPMLHRLLKQPVSTPKQEALREQVATCLRALESGEAVQELLRASDAVAQREQLLRGSKPDTHASDLVRGTEYSSEADRFGCVEVSHNTGSHGIWTEE